MFNLIGSDIIRQLLELCLIWWQNHWNNVTDNAFIAPLSWNKWGRKEYERNRERRLRDENDKAMVGWVKGCKCEVKSFLVERQRASFAGNRNTCCRGFSVNRAMKESRHSENWGVSSDLNIRASIIHPGVEVALHSEAEETSFVVKNTTGVSSLIP